MDTHTLDGRPKKLTDPNGLITEYTYDDRSRITSVSVDGDETHWHYHHSGNIESIDYPDGSSVTYTYDDAYRVTAITNALGETQRITYHRPAVGKPDGRQTDTKIYAHGEPLPTPLYVESQVFDKHEWLIEHHLGDTPDIWTYEDHDALGYPQTITDPNGQVTTQSYDAFERPSQTDASGQRLVTQDYDVLDVVTAVTVEDLATGQTQQTQYDVNGLGQVNAEISPASGTTAYTYDEAGNVATLTDGRGITITYTYDALSRVINVDYASTPSTIDVTYTYDEVGPPGDARHGLGRLTQITDANSQLAWWYDIKGNVRRDVRDIDDIAGVNTVSKTVEYTYDALDRVESITLCW